MNFINIKIYPYALYHIIVGLLERIEFLNDKMTNNTSQEKK